ncbi:glyceraldehyde-3-phosphate dehydrogenase, partial [Oceanospirillaceae bacterium]|nr:glyceraldehyde-3-phosphate dehydrogenase [Oceanospirillaceae bacterium]
MSQEQVFSDWKKREALAEAMIPLIGKVYREDNVEVSVFGRSVVNRSVISILKSHRAARMLEHTSLSVHETFPVIDVIQGLALSNVHVDIGKLAIGFRNDGAGQSLQDYVSAALKGAVNRDSAKTQADVVLYGFGRIGRLLARLLIEKTGGGQSLRLRAIVVRKGGDNDLAKRASLLRRDSVHGTFQGTITVDEEQNALIANGNVIKIIYASSPDSIDYTDYGISNAVVIDNTGKWRDEDGLSLHLRANGVSKVMLTAPGKGIKNIVMGVNQKDIESTDTILSAASCTTNAITPILKALNDKYGVDNGHVETVHAYTNDQNLIDNYHKGDRRGRAAGLNMVITETGAAKAVSKALPELE